MNEDKRIFIADLEANGLVEEENGKTAANRIWCLSFCDVKDRIVKSITDMNVIKKFFEQENAIIIMHHGLGYDIRLVEKLLNFKVKAEIIDTLGLSWSLFPDRNLHGLEAWGDVFSIPKPPIIDWNNEKLLPEYINRCQEDVKINLALWDRIEWLANELYDNQEDKWKYYRYISFKLWCVAEQQKLGVKLDIPLIKETLMELEDLKVNKIEVLTAAMPKQPIKTIKKYPKVFKKANGELSANGLKWIELVKEKGLPEDYTGDIEVITGYNDANPNSHTQIKDWLFSLGWIPDYFKYVKEEFDIYGNKISIFDPQKPKVYKSEMRKIPQVASKDEPGELSVSVKKLIEKEPELEELSSLGIISHRISIFKGFLRDQKNGRIYQGTSGLTNTLRLQHTGIVNLPSSDKPFSKNVRASLIPDEGMIMCGTDLQGIEDNTKRHYIFPYDPEYVKSQMTEGFDAHLDIAKIAGMLTEEQVENHKKGIENHKLIRAKAKQINFSAIYGVGSATLSRNMSISKKEAQTFIDAYWTRNWAVREVAESTQIKHIGAQMWLLNPVSNFWYSLRAEKDRFSTLNQGTAVYVFDKYVENMNKLNIFPNFQIHDEASFNILLENKDKTKELLQLSIQKVNEELKLNVTIGASVDFGENYSICH
tara:strand:+ start:1019 stop:2968 length:1950 start_codon:yes stop_codon:yes gene_type:complete